MESRTFNTRQFIDAMKKNGYRKAHGNWIQFKGSKVEHGIWAACAGGQALLNLGVKPKHVNYAHFGLPNYFSQEFTRPNDHTSASVSQIAKNLTTSRWYTEPVEFTISEEYFRD